MSVPLTPELIVAAYRKGLFPMADDEGRIGWYWPDPRGILPLDRFHVPRRLERTLRKTSFTLSLDRDFEGVIRGCAGREETWISDEIARVYIDMHRMGIAHSVEAYSEGRLAGGIYGVSLGGAFMGESMFSRESAASSACLVHLVDHLNQKGYSLLDVQFMTSHLRRFGAVEISRSDYLRRLENALLQTCEW